MIRYTVPYPPLTDASGNLTPPWLAWFGYTTQRVNEFTASGTTAQRPITVRVGMPFFDETLNIPIWVKTVSPLVWVDATGATV